MCTDFAVPKDYTFIDHCGQAFTKYCVEYIIFGADIFDTVAVCAVLVCICLVNYLMCMASHFAYFMRKPPIPRRQVSASRSFARPSRSRSRSQNWQTRSTSEELYSPPPKGAANSSAPNYDNNPKACYIVLKIFVFFYFFYKFIFIGNDSSSKCGITFMKAADCLIFDKYRLDIKTFLYGWILEFFLLLLRTFNKKRSHNKEKHDLCYWFVKKKKKYY